MSRKWRSGRSLLSVLLFSAVITGTAHGATQTRMQERIVERLSRPTAIGTRIRIDDMQLGDRTVSLDLERFEVYAPDAVIVVYGPDGPVRQAPPALRFYRGSVAGDEESMAVFTVGDDVVHGLVLTRDRKFEVRTLRARASRGGDPLADRHVVIDEVSVLDEILDQGEGGFTCELEKAEAARSGNPLSLPKLSALVDGNVASNNALATGTATWVLNLAIETDYELYAAIGGGSAANITTYVANLVAGASVIYKRDLQTELRIAFQSVYTTTSDPWTIVPEVNIPGGACGTSCDGSPGAFDALVELGQYWHGVTAGDPRYGLKKSAAMLVSGKVYAGASGSSSGIAWLATMCEGDFANGTSAVPGGYGGAYGFFNNGGGNGTVPNPDANAPTYTAPSSNYWPLLAFSHELGHVVGSKHTHCVALTPAQKTQYSVARDYVDECYIDENSNNVPCGYNDGAPYQPRKTNIVPAEKGTIMSYCHLNGGGTQTRWLFGKNTEPSQLIVDGLRAELTAKTPSLSSISLSAPSFSAGGSGSASVTNVAGLTYAWTITNGTFTSAATGAAVTFTANSNPVTLRVRATNAAGCSVSDVATATVSSCTYAISPSSVTYFSNAATGTINVTAGAGCAWTALSNNGFLTLPGANSGTGNGSVAFSVALNNTGSDRTGTISIADKTFTVTQKAIASVRGDFNANGKTDILWRNTSTGENVVWYLNDSAYVSGAALPSMSTTQQLAAAADLNGDGSTDLVWRNPSTGANTVWFMNQTALVGTASLPSVSGAEWNLEAIGNFNGDAYPDLVWHNHNTSRLVIWRMNGLSIAGANEYGVSDLNWHVVGAADFNADGQTDLAWRHATNGQNVFWRMNGTTLVGGVRIDGLADLNWKIVAVGDYSGDGKPDLFWHNSANGNNSVWVVNNFAFAGGLPVNRLPDLRWIGGGPR